MNRDKTAWMAIGIFLLVAGGVLAFRLATEKKPSKEPAQAAVQAPGSLKTLPAAPLTAKETSRKTRAAARTRDTADRRTAQSHEKARATEAPAPKASESQPSRPAQAPIERNKPLDDGLKQKWQARLNAYKANPYVAVSRKFFLEHYDTNKHAFPIVDTQGIPVSWLSEGRISYFARTTNYTLRLSNAQAFSHYAVSEAEAQELESRQPNDRAGQGVIYLFTRDTEAGSHTVRAEIVIARLYDKDKDMIAELKGG